MFFINHSLRKQTCTIYMARKAKNTQETTQYV